MTKPQEVQFGSQPPKNAEVQFGKTPPADETTPTTLGQDDPGIVGVVPVYAGGDAVPESATDDAQDAADAPEEPSGDEDTSDDAEASSAADTADDDTEA